MSNLDGKGTTITQCTLFFRPFYLLNLSDFEMSVNAIDADITVKSSDDVLFRLHRTNIEVQAGEFRPIDQQQLPEPAHVLAIIFQFLYPQDHPKLTDTEFETVQAVATSAEKYKIFSAMHVSQVRLRYAAVFAFITVDDNRLIESIALYKESFFPIMQKKF